MSFEQMLSRLSIEKQQEAEKWRGLIAASFMAPNDHRCRPTIVARFVISTTDVVVVVANVVVVKAIAVVASADVVNIAVVVAVVTSGEVVVVVVIVVAVTGAVNNRVFCITQFV